MKWILCSIVCLCLASACTGARGSVAAPGAKHPISLSPSLLADDGRTLHLGEELKESGSFTWEGTKYGTLYGAVGGDLDISELINREVAAKSGDGVVALEVTSSQCALNWFFPLTALPFWIGCQNYVVSGTVVSTQRTSPAASQPSAASQEQP